MKEIVLLLCQKDPFHLVLKRQRCQRGASSVMGRWIRVPFSFTLDVQSWEHDTEQEMFSCYQEHNLNPRLKGVSASAGVEERPLSQLQLWRHSHLTLSWPFFDKNDTPCSSAETWFQVRDTWNADTRWWVQKSEATERRRTDFWLCQLWNAAWCCETDLVRVSQLGCHISNLNSNKRHDNECRLSSTQAGGWQSEAFVAGWDIRGRPQELSDLKHVPLKESGDEVSLGPF